MSGVPDYTLEDTLDFKFTTRQFSSGAPFAFAAGAIEIYEDNSLVQITGAETLTLEFDGRTGLHNLRVAATAANGFENGKSYQCVVSAGTVDSVSVVGEVVQQFSIGRSAAAADLANGTDGLGAIKAETALIVADTNELQTDWADAGRLDAILDARMAEASINTTGGAVDDVTTVATTTTNSDMRGTDTAALASVATEARLAVLDAGNLPTDVANIEADTQDIQARLPAALVGGRMDSNGSALAGVAASATNLERGAKALVLGAAVGTPTTTVIDTDLTEATNDHYKGRIVTFTTGNIAGQASDITAYNGTTKELTVTALTDAPSAGDEFVIS